MEDELTLIQVVLTYIGTEPVLMIETAPTADYDSYAKAIAWMSRVRTGKLARVIPLHPVNGVTVEPEEEHKPTCPEMGCVFGRDHSGDHTPSNTLLIKR